MKDYIKESETHFDRQAFEYDEKSTTYYSGPAKVSCAYVISLLAARSYTSLLDVGCGTGYMIDHLAKLKKAQYSGLDLSANMLKVANGKKIAGAVFTQGRSDRLPYGDGQFDVVTCIQSFHHYPEPDKAMSEAYRVLKKGGLYIISDTGVGGLGAWIDNNIMFKVMKSGDCHTENKDGIARRMEKNGFHIIEKKQLQGFIYSVIGKRGN